MSSPVASPVIKIVVDSTAIPGAVNNANAALSRIGQGNGATGAQSTIQRLTMSLGGASNAARQTAANSNVAGSAFGSLGASAQAAASRLTGMGGSLAGIGFAGAALGATAVVGGLVALGSAAVAASSQMQSYRASLSTVLGDMDKAGMAMDRLTDFAAKTPFSLNQAVEGFIKLKALGLQPSEEAMMSYGNTASALGKDLNQMVEAVADAATGEFERLKEFGIKSKNQGDTVAFTFQGVTTTVKNSSDDIQKYLMAIGNTQFAGAMQKQMGTFNGAMSNLEDTWFQTMAAIGDAGLTDAVGEVVQMITNGISGITPVLVAVGNVMAGVIRGVASIATGIGGMFAGITTNGGQGITFLEGLTAVLNIVGQTAEVVGNIIGASIGAAGQVIGGVVGTVRGWFADFWDWLGLTSSKSTADMGLQFVGVLRAAKFLTSKLPEIFSAALGAIGGMFGAIGRRIAAFVGGDFNAFSGIGDEIAASFGAAKDKIGGVVAEAGAMVNQTKQNQAALDKLLGRTGKKKGMSLSDLAGSAPKPTPTAGKDDKDAAKKAADRLKKENDFWQALKDQTTAAGMLANQAEIYNKGLELRRILERDLTKAEQERVAGALGELKTAQAITTLRQAQADAADEYAVESQRSLGLTEAQRGVEDQLFKYRLDAKRKGVDIDSTAYKAAEADLKLQLDKNASLREQNDLLAKAGDFARKYSSAFDMAGQLADMDKHRDAFVKAWTQNGGVIDGQNISKEVFDAILAGFARARTELQNEPLLGALQAAANGGSLTAEAALQRRNATADYETAKGKLAASGLTPDEQARMLREITQDYNARMLKANRLIADDFLDRLTAATDQIGRIFGGVFGKIADALGDVIDSMRATADPNGGIAKLMGSIDKGLGEGFTKGANSMLDIGKGIKNLGDPLKDLKASFGKGGDAVKGIGSAIGGAMQGYQMGSAIGDFGSMLGANNGFSSGSKIGGAIGGITGNPIIAAGASIIGGLIGGLLYKPKYGTASITSGEESGVSISGNKSSYKAAAGDAGSAVQAGLASIAETLGGEVGNFAVSIGQYKGKWRVSDNGRTGKLKGKYGDVTDFGKEGSAEAIAYAIADAIKDGAITGISDFANKALKSLDTDAALSLVEAFKSITDELDAMRDPIGAAVRAINDPLDSLIKRMQAVGASTEDLNQVEEYRTKKLDEALKSQLSSLQDFMKALNGEGSGVSALDRLNADLAEFKGFQDRIANGDSTVDQSAFTQLGQQIFGEARDVYGTSTGAFQDIRAMLIAATQGLETNVTNAFNAANGDSTSAAIEAQTSAIVSQTVITNDLLAQLVAQGNTSPIVAKAYAVNGAMVNGQIY